MSELFSYNRFVELLGNLKDIPDRATPYKIDYLKKIINGGKVYKFISFEGNPQFVKRKLETFMQKELWFSFYKALNDESEFQIDYDASIVSNETGMSIDCVKTVVNVLTEMYDVCSLTYEYHDYMWQNYASGGNGMCIVFNVGDYDQLYPIEYVDKRDIDFNKLVVSGIRNNNSALAFIPWVIKNPYNQTSDLDSTREKEVRIFYSPFEEAEFNNGILEKNIKERKNYKGIAEPYGKFGLSISKVIVGNKCNEITKIDLEKYLTSNGIECEFL